MSLTTKKAFKELTDKRAWYKPLGYTESKASSLKNRFKRGDLTTDAMEQVLKDAGFEVVQERLWFKTP